MTPNEKILKRINELPNLEAVMTYLREFGYVFLDTTPFMDLHHELNLGKIRMAQTKWQFMIRRIRRGSYDRTLFFAIKMWGAKVDRIGVYPLMQDSYNLRICWKDSHDINFRKTVKRWSFPDYMTYDERRVWRAIHKRVVNAVASGKDYTPTEWYLKCKPDIVYTANPK